MSRWNGIEEVVAIAEYGSFVRAAAQLGTSTSHMSRAIADLEHRIGTQIFIRTTRRVVPTPAGRTLIDQFRRLIAEREDAILAVSDGSAPRGEVRITCSIAMGERFVAQIARDYAFAHPDVTVTLELTNRVVDLLAEGFDLAVRTGSVRDPALVATRIASRAMHLCAAPAYLAQRARPTAIDELAAHECLLGTADTWRFSIDGKAFDYRPPGRWRCNSGTAVTEAALAGFGLCQLPDFYVAHHLRSGALVPLLEHHAPAEDPVWAVYPQRRHLLPKVRLFIDRLRKELPRALRTSAGG
jgi:DNA-binding transcriptional LysR family regulator